MWYQTKTKQDSAISDIRAHKRTYLVHKNLIMHYNSALTDRAKQPKKLYLIVL